MSDKPTAAEIAAARDLVRVEGVLYGAKHIRGTLNRALDALARTPGLEAQLARVRELLDEARTGKSSLVTVRLLTIALDAALAGSTKDAAPACRTCDFSEPRKFRCRNSKALLTVGEYIDDGGAPKWCPLKEKP